eukprot:sb/3469243/
MGNVVRMRVRITIRMDIVTFNCSEMYDDVISMNRPKQVNNKLELDFNTMVGNGLLVRVSQAKYTHMWMIHGIFELMQQLTDTSKQPIKTRYLGHVTRSQPIRDQYFLTQYSNRDMGHLRGKGFCPLNRGQIRLIFCIGKKILSLNRGHMTDYQPIRDQYFMGSTYHGKYGEMLGFLVGHLRGKGFCPLNRGQIRLIFCIGKKILSLNRVAEQYHKLKNRDFDKDTQVNNQFRSHD